MVMRHLFLLSISAFAILSFDTDGGNLPSIELKTLDGSNFNTANISNDGKPIIICIWELSCKPCLAEFDQMATKYAAWQKETGVKVVAISVDDSRNYDRVKPLVRSKGWKFDFYQDKTREFERASSVSYCPFTFILDGKGHIVYRKGAYVLGDEDLIYELVKKVAKGEMIETD